MGKVTNWQKGKVVYFDNLTREGQVMSTDGQMYYVHYTAISCDESLVTKGTEIKFKLYVNRYMKQVDQLVLV